MTFNEESRHMPMAFFFGGAPGKGDQETEALLRLKKKSLNIADRFTPSRRSCTIEADDLLPNSFHPIPLRVSLWSRA
jgi:hypothetical protein